MIARNLGHSYRTGLCKYDTEERRNARDAAEKHFLEKSPELLQAFLDSCKSSKSVDPKEWYLRKQNRKYKDLF